MPDGSATAHLYRPKIATVLAEGYNLGHFRRDVLAALTVAIVALPLSMAIAVASGVSPERGLYAAVIGGFLVSALGGSRYQIGGPAGAFIVLVAATVTKFGLDGLLLTVFLSGFMLTLIGLLRLGVAHSLHSACRDRRLHLRHRGDDLCQPAQGSRRPEIARRRTRPFAAEARACSGRRCRPSARPRSRSASGSAALIFLMRRLLPNWPGMLIAVDAGLAGGLAVRLAGRDHRQPFRPTAGWLARAPIAVDLDFIGA